MNPEDLVSIVRVENGNHQAYFTFEGEKHDLGQFVKLGHTWRSEKYPAITPAKTLSEATLWVVESILDDMREEISPQIMPVEYRVVRTSLVLTERQAHAVWDVLVRLWNASAEGGDRAHFVLRATKREHYLDPKHFGAKSGWGWFQQTPDRFYVTWYEYNKFAAYGGMAYRVFDKVMAYKVLVVNLALQDLYIRFFG